MRTIGIQQLMSASLYRDDAMLDSMTKALTRAHVEQAGGVVIGEPRVAYHFGQLVHAAECDPERTGCTEDCAIVDCAEEDASVVMMRVEVDVEGGDEDA
jgi:hypothetical protein